MIVEEIMNPNILKIDSNETIRVVLKRMYETGVQRLFVFDKKDKPIGVISYNDVVLLLGSEDTMIDIDSVKVFDIMTEKVTTIDANEPIQNAASLMLRAEISGLLVTKNNKNVGVITKTDICRIVSLSELTLK